MLKEGAKMRPGVDRPDSLLGVEGGRSLSN